MSLDARWSLVALVPVAVVALVVGWGNADKVSGSSSVLLVVGSAAAIGGVAMIAVDRRPSTVDRRPSGERDAGAQVRCRSTIVRPVVPRSTIAMMASGMSPNFTV